MQPPEQPTPERPRKSMVQFVNTDTGEIRFVRFGSAEHNALTAQRHPVIGHRQLWTQVYDDSHPWR